jgi:hypothetical protein
MKLRTCHFIPTQFICVTSSFGSAQSQRFEDNDVHSTRFRIDKKGLLSFNRGLILFDLHLSDDWILKRVLTLRISGAVVCRIVDIFHRC